MEIAPLTKPLKYTLKCTVLSLSLLSYMDNFPIWCSKHQMFFTEGVLKINFPRSYKYNYFSDRGQTKKLVEQKKTYSTKYFQIWDFEKYFCIQIFSKISNLKIFFEISNPKIFSKISKEEKHAHENTFFFVFVFPMGGNGGGE